MTEPPEDKPANQALIRYKAKNLILESKNFLSEIFFTWITPVISFGSKTILEQEAIPALPKKLYSVNESESLIKEVSEQFKSQTKNREGVKLLKAIAKTSKPYVLPLLIAYTLTVICNISLPLLTKKVIAYIEFKQTTLAISLMYVGLIFLVKFTKNVALSHLCYKMAVFGFNLSNNLGLCIFNKALKFPTLCDKTVTTAQLINYTEVDAQRLSDIGWNTSAIIFFPLVMVFGIVMMFIFIGVAFIPGMVVMVIISVMTYFITKYQSKANDTLLTAKDERMKVTNQIFNQIRFIKANAWEKYYYNKLNRARNEELGKIKKVNLFNVLEIFIMWLTIPMSLSATFGTYVYMGNQLTAQIAFTTIVMFNMLEYPMNSVPSAISALTQIWSSVKRIQKFLKSEQMQNSYIKQVDDLEDAAIKINNGTFYWERQQEKKQDEKDKDKKKDKKKNKKQQQLTEESESQNQIKQSLLSQSSLEIDNKAPALYTKALKNINVQIKKGKLTIILGNIGSGKSSLLYSILGEMKTFSDSKAEINIEGSIAFVPQKAWMMSRNLEQNILMTTSKDKDLFDKSIKYACLEQDLKNFPEGVKTIIGEKGINLSGGQKARVSLARALYSDKDIYLLDDIISAVDVHVGNTIIKQCIIKYLKGKTIVMVTHAVAFAKYADEIIIMKKGEIVGQGKYQNLKQNSYFKQIEQLQIKKEEDKDSDQQSALGQLQGALPKLAHQTSHELQKQRGQVETQTNKLVEQLLMPQDRSKGKVKLATYLTYVNLNGGWPFVVVILLAMSFYVTLSVLSSIQIQKWCQHPQQGFKDLYFYMAFAIMAGIFAATRAVILVFSGIKQGSIAHKKMIKGLMYAGVPEFFDRVPTGRILNRVSKDLRELDENIGYKVGGVLVSTFSLIAAISICVYASTPYILIPAAIFIVACWMYKNYFMKTQREIVRLETISNSPVISSFTEVMNGLPSVRSSKLQESFFNRQCVLVDVNKQNKVCREAVQCWFAQRLGFLAFTVNITAVAYCLFFNNNPSMAGLLMAYAFEIDESIIWLTYSSAQLEGKMVSVERVSNFMDIQPEVGYKEYTKKWRTRDEDVEKVVSNGKVQFKQFCLRYRQNLPLVLKDLNITISPGEKIGVVGRTGAGKSTIIQALLRVVESSQGKILIDGEQITDFSLKAFRTSITWIPQEPVLIAGTLRENLDPRNQHTDQELLSSLSKCYLMETFKERQLLQTKISESGENLSIGQKQLICIARAILRQNKLVLIDQATANIDIKSDKLIQQTIRNCFESSTVITIAHRIKTILDSDRILVMDKGRVGEFDTPDRLLQMKGIFYEMHQKSMEENEL